MSTGVIGSAVLLVLAAVFVGLLVQLLRRRSRSAAGEAPRTVGELVSRRTTPDGREAPSVPAGPHTVALAPGPQRAPDAGDAAPEPLAHRVADPSDTPPTGEFGDAPWRRAARMRGDEPGAGWDTAPLPVAPPAVAPQPEQVTQPTPQPTPQPAPRPAAAGGAVPAPATPQPAAPVVDRADRVDPPSDGAMSVPAVPVPAVPVPAVAAAGPGDPAGPAPEPAVRAGSSARPAPAPRPAPGPAPATVATLTAVPARDGADGGDGPSRPLSDPDLTPLMGIPVVRPLADGPSPPARPRPTPRGGPGGRSPAAVPAGERPTVPVALDAPAAPAAPELGDPTPTDPRGFAPLPRPDDDDVAMLLPVTAVAPPPAVRTGSPQPVWFRVVRRDGEAVAGVLVALLDDHGQEVDATKTATDGGGELQAPHAGRFLMIAGSDGFQPRAVLLTVEDQPVELALLLPRSACVAGIVRATDRPATGARVVARQEGEIVDDVVTGRDGAYRFADLAEGVYALSATDHRGSVVHHVTLSEGADVPLDLDLVYRNGGR